MMINTKLRFFEHFIYFPPALNFASTPSAVTGAGDGGAPAGGGGTPTPSPAPGGAGAGGAGGGSPLDWKSAPEQFRQGYDQLKAKHEPWERLGVQPEQVTQFQGVYKHVSDMALQIGKQLGYEEDEIAEALHADPVKTLDYLRNKAAELEASGGDGRDPDAGGDQDLEDRIAAAVDQRFGPIQERENTRMTDEGNALFERTVHQCITDAFKADGIDVSNIPEDEQFLLYNATSEVFKYDDKDLHALKFEGKTAGVQRAFQIAKTMVDKYFMARSARERGAVGGGPRRPGAAPVIQGRKPTLDEMAEEPTLINPKYKVGT